jgi:hypothetical protein
MTTSNPNCIRDGCTNHARGPTKKLCEDHFDQAETKQLLWREKNTRPRDDGLPHWWSKAWGDSYGIIPRIYSEREEKEIGQWRLRKLNESMNKTPKSRSRPLFTKKELDIAADELLASLENYGAQ